MFYTNHPTTNLGATPQAFGSEYHPLFGGLLDDRRLDQLIDAQVACSQPSSRETSPPLRRLPVVRTRSNDVELFQPRFRADETGIWDANPPGTALRSGDEVDDDEIVWRLRPPTEPASQRPDHLYDHAVRVASEADALWQILQGELGDDDPATVKAKIAKQDAFAHRSQTLKMAEVWQETSDSQEWDMTTYDGRKAAWHAIDDNRKGEEGREARNANLRTVRDKPNAKLKGMSPDELADHVRGQGRQRQQRARARAKAAAKAAATGDLSAAIS